MDREHKDLTGLRDGLLRLVWWFALVAIVGGTDELFSFPSSTQGMVCDNELLFCAGNAHSYNKTFIRLSGDNSIGVSPEDSTGWVFHNEMIRMMDASTGEAASFSTVFTFQLTSRGNRSWGDGLAFVMFANQSYRGAGGRALGAYNSDTQQGTKTFCVEYDTFQNYFDPSNDHVGLDLNNLTSVRYENAGLVGISLHDGYKITSWIDYNHSMTTLEVRISNDSSMKPMDPLFNYTLNLSTIVDELMYVGFAASTGKFVQTQDLFRWSMSTSGLSIHSSQESSPSLFPVLTSEGEHHVTLIGGFLGEVLLLVLCWTVYWFWMFLMRRPHKGYVQSPNMELDGIPLDIPHRFTYDQLSAATNGFSAESKLGQGGSSEVYRGEIVSMGLSVAVKRLTEKYQIGLTEKCQLGEKTFFVELSVVSKLRHRHLVKLLGWCADQGSYLLVYELMSKGSLDRLLFMPEEHEVLSWVQRIAIVKGVAAGLVALHEGFSQQVIHRDIKSSNVMLDQDLNALVGDFGLARLMLHSSKTSITDLAGTIGYIAPEAAVSGEFSAKTDVYAFGAVLLEVACGRPAIPMETGGKTLVDLVWKFRSEACILKAADKRLQGNFPNEQMEHILLVGLSCSNPYPDARPSMSEVELILANRVPLPPVPLVKPVLQFGTNTSNLDDEQKQDYNFVIST